MEPEDNLMSFSQVCDVCYMKTCSNNHQSGRGTQQGSTEENAKIPAAVVSFPQIVGQSTI